MNNRMINVHVSSYVNTNLVNVAVESAMRSKLENYKHGAVAFCHGTKAVVCNGVNAMGIMGCGDFVESASIHAECDVVRKLRTCCNHSKLDKQKSKKKKKKKNRYNILVVRIKRTRDVSGNVILGNSRPCAICLNKMKQFGIYRVYYSMDNGSITWEKVCEMVSNHISFANKVKSLNKVNYYRSGMMKTEASLRESLVQVHVQVQVKMVIKITF